MLFVMAPGAKTMGIIEVYGFAKQLVIWFWTANQTQFWSFVWQVLFSSVAA